MFNRAVMMGETIYRSHEAVRIYHERGGGTTVTAVSYEMEDGTGRERQTYHAGELSDGMTFGQAEEWLKSLDAFAEVSDPAQDALDQVLDVLTDEQAEGIPDVFPAWASGVAYGVGKRVRYDGNLYKCMQAHTSQADWTPDATPALWTRIGDPGDEWPEWIQPTGAHDAYAQGAKVSHAGRHWTSDLDANTYEPGVYGWTEVA